MRFSTLALDWRTREGGGGKTPRTYLDIVVDGRSLLDRLPPSDQAGVLGWGAPAVERSLISQLLLREPSELPSGRVPLYVCPECGDLGCGAVTARIEKMAEAYVWSEFAWEASYSSEPEPGGGAIERFEGVGPFAFQKAEYWNVLAERINQLPV